MFTSRNDSKNKTVSININVKHAHTPVLEAQLTGLYPVTLWVASTGELTMPLGSANGSSRRHDFSLLDESSGAVLDLVKTSVRSLVLAPTCGHSDNK